MTSIAVNIGLPPKALSPNARGHWGARHKATRNYRYDAWYCASKAKYARGWKGGVPVVLDVEFRWDRAAEGYKPRDVANALAALKPAIDGLVDAGLMPDDSRKWLQIGSVHLMSGRKELGDRHAGVTLTLTEAP